MRPLDPLRSARVHRGPCSGELLPDGGLSTEIGSPASRRSADGVLFDCARLTMSAASAGAHATNNAARRPCSGGLAGAAAVTVVAVGNEARVAVDSVRPLSASASILLGRLACRRRGSLCTSAVTAATTAADSLLHKHGSAVKGRAPTGGPSEKRHMATLPRLLLSSRGVAVIGRLSRRIGSCRTHATPPDEVAGDGAAADGARERRKAAR